MVGDGCYCFSNTVTYTHKHISLSMIQQPGKKVLVTGVASYVGIHVADQFLRAGYHVLGTVQTGERTDHIIKYFSIKYGLGRFTVQEIGYPAEDNVYDFVVQGTLKKDAIFQSVICKTKICN